MSYENIIFAAVCWFCALLFGLIALWAFKRRTPMHFWSGSTVKPDEITDIPAYNRANAKMWAVYAALTALSGVAALFNMQAGVVLLVIICVPGVAGLFVIYNRIYKKYNKKTGDGKP